ncbi:TRAP transporter substrate-binding protein [Thiosulfatihalobacter marinus]|jgi:tripartite ATP-independent transporter DctP family solute receptor|uniref:TRAP transporter substrate-binding protein n=1 Tax=Thiosulfatihalobacter marinus TaxID=2792481 RepID=UPI0018D968CE|nr:TRAP transporter substrate-binding protein [Thiosulfatihalobacter marinus]
MVTLNTVLVGGFAVASIALSGVAVAETQITLAHHSAVGSINSQLAEDFKACVEAADGVEMSVAHFPAGQLGTAREVVEQVKIGAIDMTITDTAYMSNVQPQLTVWQLPFLFSGWDHAERAMDGAAGDMTRDLLLENQNVRVLSFMHNGFRDFMTIDKKVESMDDFKGMKFRSPPIPIWLKMFEALEATPVSVDWSEVYTAMQSGLVEGMESTPEGFLSSKSYEVAKYITRSGHMYNLMMMVISDQIYGRLSDAEKAIVDECAANFNTKGNPMSVEANEGGYAQLEGLGLTMLEIDKAPLAERLSTAWPVILDGIDGADSLVEAVQSVR